MTRSMVTLFVVCFVVGWGMCPRIAECGDGEIQPATDRLDIVELNKTDKLDREVRRVRQATPESQAIAKLEMYCTARTLSDTDGDGSAAPDVRAFLETKTKAEAGDVDAQYKLGGMFAKGVGTAKDDATAVLWYRKVAEQDDARGQSMLGVMYTNARGVPRDYAIALRWFRKAAEQNSAHAQYNLGHMYGTGKGVPQDDAKSAEWYRKAAEQNDVNSQRILGALYAAGRGVPQDLVQAHAWTKVSGTVENAVTKQQLMKLETQMTAEQKTAAAEVAKEIETRLARLKKKS